MKKSASKTGMENLFSGKWIAGLFFLLAFLCAISTISYYNASATLEDTRLLLHPSTDLSEGWQAETQQGLLPLAEPSRLIANCPDVPLRLVNTLPQSLSDDMSLCFQTKNESVRVYVGDALAYEYGKTPQRVYGFGVGALWHIAPLPEDAGGKTLTVELTPIGGRTGLAPYQFELGSRNDIVVDLLWERMPMLLISVLLAVIGLVSLVLFVVQMLRDNARAAASLYFGLFVLLSTVWMVSDSGLLQFLIGNKGVIYLLFGCSFYLLAIPLALFMCTIQPEYKKFYYGYTIVSSCYALLRILLYVFHVADFEAALIVLHSLMGVLILAANLGFWLPSQRAKRREQPELTIAVSVFMIAEGVSLIDFYVNDRMNLLRNGYSSGFYIGILLFALITVAGVVRKTERMRQQAFKAAYLEHRAYTDDLTGLLNAKGFDDKCAERLKSLPANQSCAVVDFDVNFFSQYNATNGLDAGDALLKEIAAMLSANCRSDELCARQEADHFVCMLNASSLDVILTRIKRADQSVKARMTAQMLLLSYGVAEITDRSLPVPALRNQAAVAKRTVKGNYENNIAVYDPALHESQMQEIAWLSGFEDALKNREFVIFLQPKIDLSTGEIGGAEALVRRIGPDGTVTSAGPIIEALERKGFVKKLDDYVLELLCIFLRRCLDEGRKVCPISSNFSRVHLYDPDFASSVAATVDDYGIPHELVKIELTETAFLVGKDVLSTQVRRLHAEGFAVAIDDFGSGYSSLNVLKDVDIDIIKLDQEFLADFASNRRADSIIEHTLHLAQKMEITTVAEGIETIEQLDFLRGIGCDLVQGYYYSRPLPAEEFIEKYLPKEGA